MFACMWLVVHIVGEDGEVEVGIGIGTISSAETATLTSVRLQQVVTMKDVQIAQLLDANASKDEEIASKDLEIARLRELLVMRDGTSSTSTTSTSRSGISA